MRRGEQKKGPPATTVTQPVSLLLTSLINTGISFGTGIGSLQLNVKPSLFSLCSFAFCILQVASCKSCKLQVASLFKFYMMDTIKKNPLKYCVLFFFFSFLSSFLFFLLPYLKVRYDTVQYSDGSQFTVHGVQAVPHHHIVVFCPRPRHLARAEFGLFS